MALIDLLRSWATDAPERELLVTPERVVTYADAVARSEALARGLHGLGVDRFGFAVTDPSEVVAVLAAAAAVGVEACAYPATLDDAGIDELAGAFGHDVVLADRPVALAAARAVSVASLGRPSGALPPSPPAAPVLILTTGTTGRPKGARHEWSRLVAGTRDRGGAPGQRWLLAYNLNQFAGVQVMLHAVVSGSTLVAGRTNQPRDALAAMTALGVTHASATPTFWRFLVGLLDEPTAAALPLQQITLGGEAVPAALLDRLRSLFPQARLSQVYASTEFGSSVSVRDGRNGLPLSVLERGDDADVQFRIVDGELHARSRVGMLGYADEDDSEGWRPTGDLVEVRDDRIHFVGRTSEIINVGGVKVHPLSVEEALAGVDGVALALVYGRPNALTGQIVAVDVVPTDDLDDPEALKERIRAACAHLPPAALPRRIRLVDALDVRGSKLDRRTRSESTSP